MSKTSDLRRAITARLRTACPRVEYGQAGDETARPYIVYTLETIGSVDDMETLELEINCMDYGTNTELCETIADQAEALFDKWYYLNDEIQFSTYVDRRQPVTEEDRSIIRRRLLIEIHMTERRDK
ncbi:hypothetical protein INF37_04645 [Pseudoflavonifractor sp. DSM 107456]|uniref:DUF3168 domain-containing protein n=1 Tax=Pseudoflavonifractor gallinarum TaxID=2779352 RepID=A0ABR9R9G8_9FIRM|nr:hypothetical protein [Pseudoflavonifractor gallinarum]MBE5055286.1 hypothetical protein [Pseudoflavonifractor gallinarum]